MLNHHSRASELSAFNRGETGSTKTYAVMMIRTIDDNQTDVNAARHIDVSERKVAFDYLRAFAVVLVLCHHAVIGYTISAFINFDNPIATASPIVNDQRWAAFDLLVVFNETFFMPLLFFVSGMFVWPSLVKKGARGYIKRRLTRLGLPFVIGVAFLIPLAYYPAQLQVGLITGVESSYDTFWLGMVRSGFGTAGPLWFLWLLLAFDCITAGLYRAIPRPKGLIKKRSAIILSRPAAFFGALLGISIAAYLPPAIIFGPQLWIGTGPFHAQLSRIPLYLVYFLAGTAIGAYGIERSAFRPGGAITKYWWGWLVVGLMSYVVFIFMVVVITDKERTIVSEIAFVVCCGAIIVGIIGLFLRIVKRPVSIFDNLSENAYGIYIVHYVFVTWLQYVLLRSTLAPSIKGMAVFFGTLVLSWGTVAAIRRIPVVAKVI